MPIRDSKYKKYPAFLSSLEEAGESVAALG
jgi:hypothetical protein